MDSRDIEIEANLDYWDALIWVLASGSANYRNEGRDTSLKDSIITTKAVKAVTTATTREWIWSEARSESSSMRLERSRTNAVAREPPTAAHNGAHYDRC